MTKLFIIIQGFLFFTLITSCKRPPEYSTTPSIEYVKIDTIFHKFPTPDTVIITINFKDGDGDLGLEEADSLNPYQELNFANPIVKIQNSADYNAYSYAILDIDNDGEIDTIKVERNPYHFNYYVEFHKEQPNGSFQLLDDSTQCVQFLNCIPFHGRFMRLNRKDFTDDVYVGPLEGKINFTMSSVNFYTGKFKFKVYIYDRALHVSNTIETNVIEF